MGDSAEDYRQSAAAENAVPADDLTRRVGVVFLHVLIAVVAFSFAFTPLRASQDEWWHLKTGQWILQHGKIPKNDIFTYTGENLPWHNHEWLSQAIFYKVFSIGENTPMGGVRALILFKALIVAATFVRLARLIRERGVSWPIVLLLAVIAADISRRTIYPRPPIFSYLLFTVTLLMLYGWKLGKFRFSALWALPLIMILWANLHGMCLLGIVAAAAFAGGEFLETFVRERRDRTVVEALRKSLFAPAVMRLSLLTAMIAAAMLLNPSGHHIFFLSEKFTNDPLLKRAIAEMLPPPFLFQKLGPPGTEQWMFVPISMSFWFTVAALVVLLIVNRGRMRYGADYLLVGFFTYQALMHWRLLPLFAIAALGPVGSLLSDVIRKARESVRIRLHRGITAFAVLIAVIFVFFTREPRFSFFERNVRLVRGEIMDPFDYPEPLMAFIRQVGFPDRMFSQINYCGYAIWSLSPEHHKLFTDNRFDVFGSTFYREEAVVVNALEPGDRLLDTEIKEGWDKILDRYGVNFVVMSRDMPVNERLREAGWRHVYYYTPPGGDRLSGFNIWLRNSPDFNDTAVRAGHAFARQNPGLPPPAGLP